MKFLELEKTYADYLNVAGAVTCNTGTAALHLALEALKLPKDSEVIVPEFTMVATAWAVYYSRLTPIFVDCDDNMLIDLDLVEKAITPKTKVLMVTHVYGRVVNMTKVMELAKKYNLRVIEDAAEAHNATWENKLVGTFDIGCFSFYKNKIIHGEEGGLVTSNDLNFLSTVRDMKSMSFGKEHNYQHNQIGFNYRMTDSQAKLILKSFNKLEKNINHRKKIEKTYDKYLNKSLLLPNREVVWVYDIKVPKEKKDGLVNYLVSQGIDARHSFKPMSIQSPFNYSLKENLKAFGFSKNICYLPSGENITIKKAKYISKLVNQFLSK
jgi:perosamine synthetase